MINTSQYLHFTISCQVEKSHIDIFFTKARSTCYGPNDIGSNVTQFKSYPNNITILMISLSDLFISQLSLYFDSTSIEYTHLPYQAAHQRLLPL